MYTKVYKVRRGTNDDPQTIADTMEEVAIFPAGFVGFAVRTANSPARDAVSRGHQCRADAEERHVPGELVRDVVAHVVEGTVHHGPGWEGFRARWSP